MFVSVQPKSNNPGSAALLSIRFYSTTIPSGLFDLGQHPLERQGCALEAPGWPQATEKTYVFHISLISAVPWKWSCVFFCLFCFVVLF